MCCVSLPESLGVYRWLVFICSLTKKKHIFFRTLLHVLNWTSVVDCPQTYHKATFPAGNHFFSIFNFFTITRFSLRLRNLSALKLLLSFFDDITKKNQNFVLLSTLQSANLLEKVRTEVPFFSWTRLSWWKSFFCSWHKQLMEWHKCCKREKIFWIDFRENSSSILLSVTEKRANKKPTRNCTVGKNSDSPL